MKYGKTCDEVCAEFNVLKVEEHKGNEVHVEFNITKCTL